jgi:YebC/PmpR family DNA-binding regulatory protein
MAGHSKWANIKHRKGAQDKKRGKLFSKLIKEITAAVKVGGGPDPSSNPRLRLAMDKAFAGNMTKDTVERAIKRAAGGDEGANMAEIRYEGYGPAGVALMVDCLTDNHKRSVADVRHAITKSGGNLGTDGSVSYMFTKQGVLSYAPGADEEKIMETALEAGAEDVVVNDDSSIDVITQPETISDVKDAMVAAGFAPDNFEVTMEASMKVELDLEAAEKMLKLIDKLEDLDDVQEVYSNAEISDEILQQLG